jgi:hypothetical protein
VRWLRWCALGDSGGPTARPRHPRPDQCVLCADAEKAQAVAASLDALSAELWPMAALTRQQKITFGEMRASGVRGVLIYCSDYKCSHSIEMSADRWPDDVRLSDIEPRFTCQACGHRGADIRPNFGWVEEAARRATMSGRHTSGLTKPLDRTEAWLN